MNQKVNWNSPKTQKIFQEEIKNSPDNLSNAFKAIALRLKCGMGSVQCKWYTVFRFKTDVFKTSSDKTTKVNGKNSPAVRYNPRKKPVHQVVISSQNFDGMKVFTVKQFFAV